MKYSLYDKANLVPANLWTPRGRLRLDMFDIRSLLVVDCGAFNALPNASNTTHDSVGCGVLFGRPFSAGELVRYYYRTLVYSNLTTQNQVQKTYGDGVLFVTVEDVST